MPETEQQDKTLSEIVVKEAIGKGMDSPMRETILEVVEEADGSAPRGGSSLPLAGALFGAGAVLGFLAGRESPDLEETSLEDIQEPEIIEDVVEETTESDEGVTEMDAETESETETDADGGSSRLGRILLAVGLLAGVAVLRRRLSSEGEEEWEPIEEFEPATSDELDEEETDEELEAESETDDEEIEEE